jgi:hypothetical protein
MKTSCLDIRMQEILTSQFLLPLLRIGGLNQGSFGMTSRKYIVGAATAFASSETGGNGCTKYAPVGK